MYEQEKESLRLYSHYIAHFLRPSYIRGFLTTYLDEESVEKILSEEKLSRTAAAQMLLDKMLELEEAGWFQGFLDMLQVSDYTGLHMAISKWDFKELEDVYPHRKLLDQVEMSITKNMKPRELLPYMSCLTHRECEEIRAVEEQKGCVAASELLVDSLRHCDKSNWFKVFKLALENCSQNLALQLLEPDENGNCVQDCEEVVMPMVCFEYREDGESDNLMSSNSETSVTEQRVKDAEGGVASVCERHTEKKLREYQKELSAAANSGLNTIICAPTGCGKTIVAVAICEHHLKKYPEKAKVVFMATKVEVVGFTASVGIGSFKNVPEAENNICQLCANLDARVITTVTKNIDELRSFVHTPEKDFFPVPPRTSDPFILIIKNIMRNIEQLAIKVYNIGTVSQVQRGDYGSQMYEQWIVDVQKRCTLLQFTNAEEERKVCRALYTYTEHLRKYNDALIINEDARTKDALDFMDSFIKDISNAAPDPTERQLIDLYHGMTLTGQKGVLDSFKSSDQSKILIATSVADEGIDIPQCNLVLMYEYVGNVVKMVQVRGRGRAQGSRCFLISSRQERIDKEKLNMDREKLVEAAIKLLQDSPERLCAKVDRFQKEDVARRAHANLNVEKSLTEGSYQLLCGKCKKFACSSDDLRVLKESHHVVLDRSIFQRCGTKPHSKIKTFDNITKKEKMFCSDCNHDWGIIASYMNIENLPVLKIEGFIVQDRVTKRLQFFRKWRDVTFRMREFDVSEMTEDMREPRT
ncbi:hypothetical protein PDJAM_G00078240 [Pangasius djambal]|uniref:Uncharacterized protein n=1 Tax=Pangasius djambal TaxID=1691987 RepID=A0ACC5Z1V6_9TELE|nr:hypothetical protein [Pangasius djambal]